MAQSTVKWIGEGKKFVGIDSTNHGVVISSAGEDGGIGAKPSDLLLLALGSCTAYDVVNILTKKRANLTGLEVQVTAEQQSDPPWTFQKFHVHYIFQGKELKEKAIVDAIELSHEKYCSVSSTLRRGAELTHDYQIINS